MLKFKRLRQVLLYYFAESKWYTVLLFTLLYALSSWYLLSLAGESDITSGIDFVYWLLVTGSTVGYGDLSPQTDAGKLIVALYVIPLGLSIFALIISRIAAWVGFHWKKGVSGLKTLHLNDHILVIGWNESRTLSLLDLLLKERNMSERRADIVLCVKADIDNPMPGVIEFVKVDSFNKDDDMNRACVATAATILMDNPQDDVTMTTALYCSQRNPEAHKVAYFKDESLVSLLNVHCPKVECAPSVAVEMLVKAAFDPGSSILHHDLISIDKGQAQFSMTVPSELAATSFEQLYFGFKRQYNAALLGFAPQANYQNLQVNPSLDTQINPGDRLFYIADSRIQQPNWSALGA